MSRVLELFTARPEDTRALGEAVAGLLSAGDAVVLTGDLGAGKTTFVQGAARGLGVEAGVTSPTFTLVRQYRGRLPVNHVDVYRLERIQEVIDLGLDDLADPDAVTFVEWGDAVAALLPEHYLEVELWSHGPGTDHDGRLVVMTGSGTPWAERWERLESAVEPWLGPPEPSPDLTEGPPP